MTTISSAEPTVFDQSETGLIADDQWRAETLQVVNWGGFGGHHLVPIDPTGTLLSGESGTGKSSLLDSITALLHTANVPFNGASNGNLGGRPRQDGQRTLLNYLRGKTDEMDADGEKFDKDLRGNGRATWSAISLTWVNDSGARFTAMRYYYVPATATASRDVSPRFATIKSTFDISSLELLVGEQFSAKARKREFPGLSSHDTYETFIHTIFATLGIGAGANGKKALALLATIQAAGPVTSVNDLFRTYVLERPETYEHADNAITHFNDLEDMYQVMVDQAERLLILTDIESVHLSYSAGIAEAEVIDALGAERPAGAPTAFNRWLLDLEERLLEAAEDANIAARRTNDTDVAEAEAEREEANTAHNEAVLAVQAHGHDALFPLERAIERAQTEHARVESIRTRFSDAVGSEQMSRACDQAAFEQWKAESQEILDGYAAERDLIRDERDEQMKKRYRLDDDLAQTKRELASLEKREGSVPEDLHNLRVEMATRAGLDPVDLPFLAEVVDLAPGAHDWRTAAEVVYYALGRTLLVEESFKAEFRRRIDPIRSRIRLSHEGVLLTDDAPVPGAPGYLSSKIVYKPGSPYARAASLLLSSRARDALLVESADDFIEHGPESDRLQVAPSGQTRNRTGGAHGGQGRGQILGFSNEAAIAFHRSRLVEIEADLEPIESALAALAERGRILEAQAETARHVVAVLWRDIDLDGATAALAKARQDRDDLLASDDVLRDLKKRQQEANLALRLAEQRVTLADQTRTRLAGEYERLVEDKDGVTRALEAIEDDPNAALSPEQAEVIEAHAENLLDLDDLIAVQRQARKVLVHALGRTVAASRSSAEGSRRTLENAFAAYLERWPDPDLVADVGCYPEFLEILDGVRTDGLDKSRTKWRNAMAELNSVDLMHLQRAVARSIETVRDRMRPINDILRGLPFGAQGGYLQIHIRTLSRDEEVASFRRDLRALAETSTVALSDEEHVARFHQVRALIMRMRSLDDVRWRRAQVAGEFEGPNTRDRLLDVRGQVEITAKRYSLAGVEESTYAYLGNQSGGETQELVSFLIGAALRYHLGDDTRSVPKYAFVVIDEGFIKADSKFAGRAVAAWQTLGFQLLVGTPVDKHPGLEPYMPTTLLVSKAANGQSAISVATRRGTGKPGDPDLEGPR